MAFGGSNKGGTPDKYRGSRTRFARLSPFYRPGVITWPHSTLIYISWALSHASFWPPKLRSAAGTDTVRRRDASNKWNRKDRSNRSPLPRILFYDLPGRAHPGGGQFQTYFYYRYRALCNATVGDFEHLGVPGVIKILKPVMILGCRLLSPRATPFEPPLMTGADNSL